MDTADSVVYVVDDDPAICEALAGLMRSIGLQVKTFASAHDFLRYRRPDTSACLVLDVRLPGLSGLDLQSELARTGEKIPIVFITGVGDIPMSVRAMKAGAVEFLSKPFRDQDLLDAVRPALELDRLSRRQRADLASLRANYEALSPREQEVMALVVKGLPNKQSAAMLGVAETTIKVHRQHVMRKMGARSVAELVRMAQRLR